MIHGNPVTEMVYIHSKAMVVDDQYLLIGSANINDRSQSGSRDSELAVNFNQMVMRDTNQIHSMINGSRVPVSKMVFETRIRMFKEHCGMLEEEDQVPDAYSRVLVAQKNTDALSDPFSYDFAKVWDDVARVNTRFYREVFACYPDDTMNSYGDIELLSRNKPNKEHYLQRKGEVKGFLVEFPYNFCESENFQFKIADPENLMPMTIFT